VSVFINSVWVKEGECVDWPLNVPVKLVDGSTATAREHRKTKQAQIAGTVGRPQPQGHEGPGLRNELHGHRDGLEGVGAPLVHGRQSGIRALDGRR
jgi:hypothetical protein